MTEIFTYNKILSGGSILVWCVRTHTHTIHKLQQIRNGDLGWRKIAKCRALAKVHQQWAAGTLLTLAVAALPFVTCLLEMWM